MQSGGGESLVSVDLPASMAKRSLRVPFGLLFLIAVATVLSCRTAVRRGILPPPLNEVVVEEPLTPSPLWNATLLRLASVDVGEREGRKEVEDLLDTVGFRYGRETSATHRSIALWRRFRYVGDGGRKSSASIRIRAARDFHLLPEFRRALRDWFRNRRYQPGVMSDLLSLVKAPIDRHRGGVGTQSDSRYRSCAVVGNSGILLQHEYGDLIDSHDLVIRLNNARINGYQRNVGAKTGLSFVNSNILHLCARRESCFCHPYGEDVPIIMYICQAIHFLDYMACNTSHKAPLLITDARFDILCARIVKYYSLKRFVEETGKVPETWDTVHDAKTFHYSSGMQAVMLAVGVCDKVGIFGFGKLTDAKHHYHTNQKEELDLHDYEAEYAFYQDLIQRPQVIPFLSDSKFKIPPVAIYH